MSTSSGDYVDVGPRNKLGSEVTVGDRQWFRNDAYNCEWRGDAPGPYTLRTGARRHDTHDVDLHRSLLPKAD